MKSFRRCTTARETREIGVPKSSKTRACAGKATLERWGLGSPGSSRVWEEELREPSLCLGGCWGAGGRRGEPTETPGVSAPLYPTPPCRAIENGQAGGNPRIRKRGGVARRGEEQERGSEGAPKLWWDRGDFKERAPV